jgi:hypothetical protein
MTTTTLPTHESLEQAFQEARKVVANLPPSIESREAKRLLDCSEDVAHAARDHAYREAD